MINQTLTFLDPVMHSLSGEVDKEIASEAMGLLQNLIEEIECFEEETEINALMKFQASPDYISHLYNYPPWSEWAYGWANKQWKEFFYRKLVRRFDQDLYLQYINREVPDDHIHISLSNPLVPSPVMKEWVQVISVCFNAMDDQVYIFVPNADCRTLKPSELDKKIDLITLYEVQYWWKALDSAKIYKKLLEREMTKFPQEKMKVQEECFIKVAKLTHKLKISLNEWTDEGIEAVDIQIEPNFFRTLENMEKPKFGLGCDFSTLLSRIFESLAAAVFIPKQDIDRGLFRSHRRKSAGDILQRDVFQHSDGAGRSIRIHYQKGKGKTGMREIIFKSLIVDAHPS